MITCYFGLPGCGKSTMLTKIAVRELKRIREGKSVYKRVLSNFYIKGCDILDYKQIGQVDMSGSLLLIDEITLYADSRDFKNFSQPLKEFFCLHRHYKVDIIYATQAYDRADKTIRDLTQELFYIRKAGPVSYAQIIYRKITITEDQEIKYGYTFATALQTLTNLRQNLKFVWRPRYYKYFDSFDCPPLPVVPFGTYS